MDLDFLNPTKQNNLVIDRINAADSSERDTSCEAELFEHIYANNLPLSSLHHRVIVESSSLTFYS